MISRRAAGCPLLASTAFRMSWAYRRSLAWPFALKLEEHQEPVHPHAVRNANLRWLEVVLDRAAVLHQGAPQAVGTSSGVQLLRTPPLRRLAF
jgi:hypothetical protein